MNKNTVRLRDNSTPEKAYLTKAQAWQKGCFSLSIIAEFAALFCTPLQPAQYGMGAVESHKRAVESLVGAMESHKRAVESLVGAVESFAQCSGKLDFTAMVLVHHFPQVVHRESTIFPLIRRKSWITSWISR